MLDFVCQRRILNCGCDLEIKFHYHWLQDLFNAFHVEPSVPRKIERSLSLRTRCMNLTCNDSVFLLLQLPSGRNTE